MPKKDEEIGSSAQGADYLAGLSSKQARAIPMLAVGATAVEVAKAVSVSPSQLSAWRKNPGFMRALADARRSMIREAEHELVSLARDAVKTVSELMTKSTNELIRLRAATIVFARIDAWSARDGDQAATDGGHSLQEVLSALTDAH